MIPEDSDPVAVAAQADIHRLYVTVIQPALVEFAPVDDITGLETSDLEVFLEAARQNTRNALCYEIRRTFALTISALFERQLRFWLIGKRPTEAATIQKERWPKLIERSMIAVGGTTVMETDDLEMLWSVANAVRHGNGTAVNRLLRIAPQFWDQSRNTSNQKWRFDLVGNMRISDCELQRYVKSVMQFWHCAGASRVPST